MKSLFLLLLLCHVSSPVKHSLKFLFTASSGIQNLPELMIVVLVDDVQAGSYNSKKTVKLNQDVWKKLFKDNPGLMELYKQQCFEILPKLFKSTLDRIMQQFNQSEGVHILQAIQSYESDEQTGETVFVQCGYDGEDFISFDLKKQTWILLKPEADVIKQEWDADKARMKQYVHFLTKLFPVWLKMSLNYGRSVLLRTVRPSVSVLQKSPSSLVSCHATGFYPDRATMFWRKDGDELHEDVDHGEILPNHDGTFQMRVNLNISSVKPEDWRRYDCVFRLSGVEDIITTSNKAVRRNTLVSAPRTKILIGAVIGVVLMLLAVCIGGFFIWRTKNKKTSDSDRNSAPTVTKTKRQTEIAPNRRLQKHSDSEKDSEQMKPAGARGKVA